MIVRRTNHVIKSLELSALPLPSGRGEGPKTELITNGRRFHQSCLCNGSSINIRKGEVWRALGLVNISQCWGDCVEAAPTHPHNNLPYASLLSGCS